ncbi:MAG: hypothetical protein DRH12_19060, partial [Deltaproteobacteria bacterium]
VAGEALFTDLQAGRYQYRVTAENHQEITGRCWIKPGVTSSEYVFLPYNLVTIEWEVVPTTIEDRYTIQLKATYETDVPAANVVAEPASINLPHMRRGDVYNGEFTLTNYGLIRGKNLKVTLPEDDKYFKYEILGGLPDSIEPKERIVVPYRVTCLVSPNPADEEGEEGEEGEEKQNGKADCETRVQTIRSTVEYECADGATIVETTEYSIIYEAGDCESPISFTWGPFGGGEGGEPANGNKGASMEVWAARLKAISELYRISGLTALFEKLGLFSTAKGSVELPVDGIVCWPKKEREEVISDKSLKDCLKERMIQVGCWVDTVRREYNDDAVDLAVKVPGGRVQVYRSYYNNGWHWDLIEDRLEIIKNECDQIVALKKNGVVYPRKYEDVFVNGTYQITQLEDGFRWKDKFGNWKYYDTDGNLLSYGNRNGTIAQLGYDVDGKVTTITDRNGRIVLNFSYDDDRLVFVEDYDHHRVTYEYTAEGYLQKVTNPEGGVTTYSYDSEGRTIAKEDPAGRFTYSAYDESGYVRSVVDKDGNGDFFEYSYDEYRKQYYVRIKTLSGKIKEVWYDRDGDVARIDVNGKTIKRKVKIGFPQSGAESISLTCLNTQYGSTPVVSSEQSGVRIVKTWDEKNNLTVKYFDNRLNLTKIVYPDGSSYQFEYEPVYNNLIKKIDPMGVATLYEYDSNGNLIKMTQAAGTDAERVLTYTYDEYGQLLSFSIEGDSNTEKATVTMSYDDNGNLASVTDPEGNTMRLLEHDSLGNVLRMRDPRGNEWTYEYDSLGRIISETNPLGNKTSFEYDGANNLTAIINAHLKRFEFSYDDHNNRLSIVGPDGNALTTVYRPDGKFTKITDQSGKSATFTYDNDGRLTEVCDGVGNKIRYAYEESQATSAKFGNPV